MSKVITFGWVDIKKSLDKISKQANYDALTATAEIIIQDTEPFVPCKTGRLRKSAKADIDKDGCTITYTRRFRLVDEDGNGKYVDGASELYEGRNPFTGDYIRNWTTPGTGPYWFDESFRENEDKWKQEFTREWIRGFTKGGTPKNSGITR